MNVEYKDKYSIKTQKINLNLIEIDSEKVNLPKEIAVIKNIRLIISV